MPSLPSLEMFTRIGFAARGLMYLIIGYLALRFGQTESGEGALATLAQGSGKLLLGIMALGFAAYGVWRLSEALVDTEGHGSDAKGSAARIGGALSGIIHIGLAIVAANLASGGGGSGGGQSGAEQGAATALALPGGPLLLLVAGAVLIGTGLWQLVKAVKADFLRHLDGRVANQAWVMWLGRAGYAARGIVFVIIGWSLLQAGLSESAAPAGGMEQALGSLSGALLSGVALGLLLFGLFSFVEARYRRINDPNVAARLRGAVRG
ncbi:MAG TPA: DUF1206 domain-containing protein [Allosphingosinicella sp.]|jgi:hypothetical protein